MEMVWAGGVVAAGVNHRSCWKRGAACSRRCLTGKSRLNGSPYGGNVADGSGPGEGAGEGEDEEGAASTDLSRLRGQVRNAVALDWASEESAFQHRPFLGR